MRKIIHQPVTRSIRLTFILSLVFNDIIFALVEKLWPQNANTRQSLVGHLAGAIAGLLIGYFALENRLVNKLEVKLQRAALMVFLGLIFILIVINLFGDIFPEQNYGSYCIHYNVWEKSVRKWLLYQVYNLKLDLVSNKILYDVCVYTMEISSHLMCHKPFLQLQLNFCPSDSGNMWGLKWWYRNKEKFVNIFTWFVFLQQWHYFLHFHRASGHQRCIQASRGCIQVFDLSAVHPGWMLHRFIQGCTDRAKKPSWKLSKLQQTDYLLFGYTL